MEEYRINRLFISYGHDDNAVLVEKLVKDLDKRGYHVFFDKTSIKEGNHWRRIITEALLNSDMTIAFASRYSVRNPGVCLDELNIAASIQAASIQTILLEKDVKPLTNIGELNFIDMSDWPEHYSLKNGFDMVWYNSKLELLIQRLNAPEIIKYAEEMTYLKNVLRPIVNETIRESSAPPRFYGRDWLKNQVGNWINRPELGRTLIIDGAPGVGKSSFVMHLFFSFEEAITAIYCKRHGTLDSPEEIVKLLIYKMCGKFPDYRAFVLKRLQDDTSSLRSLSSMMYALFIDPLSQVLDGGRQTHYILIDGIDELDDFDSRGIRYNPLVNALNDRALDRIREYFRFIITCRTEPTILNRFQENEQIHIDSMSNENLSDVREYVENELTEILSGLSEPEKQQIVQEIVTASEGILLYCNLVIDEIKNKQRSITDLKLPRGLYNLYFDEFESVFKDIDPDTYDRIFGSAISILATQRTPIPKRTLYKACNWNSRMDRRFYEIFGEYLIASDHSVRLFHKSLTDWLFSDAAGSLYGLNEDDYYSSALLLLHGCYEALTDGVDTMNEYELLNIIPIAGKLITNRRYMKEEHTANEIQSVMESDELLKRISDNAVECINHNEFSKASDYLKVMEEYFRLAEITGRKPSDCFCKAKVISSYVRGKIEDSSDNLEGANSAYQTGINYLKDNSLSYADFYPMLFAYAFSFYRLGRYSEAIEIYEKIIESDTSRKIDVIEAKISCSRCYRVNYDSSANETRLNRAMQILDSIENDEIEQELMKTSHRIWFKYLLHKAWTFDNLEFHNEALQTIEHAELLSDNQRREDSEIKDPDTIIETGDIAMLYYVKTKQERFFKNFDKATEDVKHAIELFSSIYGGNSLRVTDFIDLQGNIQEDLGDMTSSADYYLEAEKLYDKSLKIKERSYTGDTQSSLMYSLDNLIRVKMKIRKPRREIMTLIERDRQVNANRIISDESIREIKEKELDVLVQKVLDDTALND